MSMVKLLLQIKKEMAGASPETIANIDKAIAQAKKADEASAKTMRESNAEFKRLLKERADATMTYSKAHRQAMEEGIKAEEDLLATMEATAKLMGNNPDLQNLINVQKATIIQLKEQKAAAQAAGDSFSNFINKSGINKDFSDSFLGQMFIAGPEGFSALNTAMADAMDSQKLFAAGLYQMQEATMDLFKKFDESQASLAQQTASTGEYNDMLYDVQESNKAYNVTVEEAAKAIGDLHREMTVFNRLSSEQQATLVTTTARMEALGVSTGVGAKQFDNMIMGMGMTAGMANEATEELVALGDSIGMAADQISEGFNAAASELAKYGPDAIDVFKGMAAAAKATGVEMGTLMSVTKQFDTFEGAATSAGKLNAILGGGVVNSMDLLNAKEHERVRLLIQSMQLSGKNFQNLNRFERQAIASAAGISDMAEANKVFSMSLSAYDEMQAKAKGASAEQAKLEERAQAATTFGDKLKRIGEAFAVGFLPVLELFHGFTNIVLELNDLTGGIFIPLMVGIIGVFAMLSRIQQINNMAMSVGTGLTFVRTAASSGLAAAQATLTTATVAEGTAAAAAAPANTALATSFAAMLAPLVPLTPIIVALGAGIGGLGLAIAAPLIALSVLAIVFRDIFLALLEAPKAIGEAIVGLLGFAAAGAAAMVIMATGMAIATAILLPFAGAMAVVAQPLAMFAGAMIIAAGAFYLFGLALERIGIALKAFRRVGLDDLGMAALSLLTFTLLMIPLAIPLAVIGILVGVPLMLLAEGLLSFAEGIRAFRRVSAEAMFAAVFALTLFTYSLIGLAIPLAIIGLLVGIPLILLGKGLMSFGKGIKEFNKVSNEAMFTAASSIALFTALLIPLAVPLTVIGLLVALPLILLAKGLSSFAKGIRAFRRVSAEALFATVASLTYFTVSMIWLALPLAYIGTLISVPLMLLGVGLASFGKSVAKFAKVTEGSIEMMTMSLVGLALGLGLSGWVISTFGLAAAPGLAAISISLGIFAAAISRFAGVDINAAAAGIGLVGLLGLVVLLIGNPAFLTNAYQFTAGLVIASIGLMAFSQAIGAFNAIGMADVLFAVLALTTFSLAMAFLVHTGLLAYLIIGLLALSIPMMIFASGLVRMGEGLAMIRDGLSGLTGLTTALATIADLGIGTAFVLSLIAASIMRIGFAMMFIPETKMISFGVAMDSYTSAIAAVNALTPDSVESAERVVEAASDYADIQATMRMPDEDSFVQSLKNALGIGGGAGKKGGKGQDIILELNGRELGRAVDAIINKKHNLAID